MFRRRRRKSGMLLLVILLIAGVIWYSSRSGGTVPDTEKLQEFAKQATEALQKGRLKESELIRVIDGDTLLVWYGDKEERVRLIGIDTPESVHPEEEKNSVSGAEASQFTKNELRGTSKVYLEFDIETRDKYDRLLAYVYYETDAGIIMLNRVILKEGYAQTLTIPPNVRYSTFFQEDQKKAKNEGKGLWRKYLISKKIRITESA